MKFKQIPPYTPKNEIEALILLRKNLRTKFSDTDQELIRDILLKQIKGLTKAIKLLKQQK